MSCDDGCISCDLNSSDCTACNGNYYLLRTAQTCTLTCPTGDYGVTTPDRKCLKCDLPCLVCTGSGWNGTCSSCKPNSGYYLYSNNTCLENCPDNYYEDTG